MIICTSLVLISSSASPTFVYLTAGNTRVSLPSLFSFYRSRPRWTSGSLQFHSAFYTDWFLKQQTTACGSIMRAFLFTKRTSVLRAMKRSCYTTSGFIGQLFVMHSTEVPIDLPIHAGLNILILFNVLSDFQPILCLRSNISSIVDPAFQAVHAVISYLPLITKSRPPKVVLLQVADRFSHERSLPEKDMFCLMLHQNLQLASNRSLA